MTHRPVIGSGLAAELLCHRGRWVAVVDQHVVEEGDGALAVAERARAAGYEDPLIMCVRQSDGHAFIHEVR